MSTFGLVKWVLDEPLVAERQSIITFQKAESLFQKADIQRSLNSSVLVIRYTKNGARA